MSNNEPQVQLRKDLRFMLVDDDEFHLEFASDLLSDIGVRDVLTATTVTAAHAKIKSSVTTLNLIIFDLYMPGMNGFDLMAKIGIP